METCCKLCEEVKSKGVKMIEYEDFYIDLLKCIFLKASKSPEARGNYITNLVLMFIEMLPNLKREDTLDEKQMKRVCQELQNILASDDGKFINWTNVKNDSSWFSFIKTALKFGLQPNSDPDGILLDTLGKVCNNFSNSDEDSEQINKIFQWTLSHSEFLNIMLGSTQKKCKLKDNTLQNINLYINKDKTIILPVVQYECEA